MAPPGGVLVGEQAKPDDRTQQLVLDRLVIAVDCFVENVIHVVGVPQDELGPAGEAEADDVAAVVALHDETVDREALAKRLRRDLEAAEARRLGRAHELATSAGYGLSAKYSASILPSSVAGSSARSHSRATSSQRPVA